MFSLLGAHRYPLWPGTHAEVNLALDEALLRAGLAGSSGSPSSRTSPVRGPGGSSPQASSWPLLWLWRNPPCIVLGRGQHIEREADLMSCTRDGIPVLRRATGGGAVYHGPGNVNITLVTRDAAAPPLRPLSTLMAAVVRELGLVPRLTGRGLFIGGGKLCGFAALRSRGGVLAHSTLLVSTPAAVVLRYLAPQPATPHPLDSRRSPVTSLAEHGLRPGDAELAAVITLAASRLFGPALPRAPEPREGRWARQLLATRYRYLPWHLTGEQKKKKKEEEEVWTAQQESLCTG